MVERSYMTQHLAPPSAPKVFLDQQVIPALIDLAGGMEAGLQRVAGRARRTPLTGILALAGLGALLGLLLPMARRR